MATVEELDHQIAEKEKELAPLTEAAAAACEHCLDLFAAALSPKITALAQAMVLGQPEVTNPLQASGRLAQLKAAVQALERNRRTLVDDCLGSAGLWVHLHPQDHVTSGVVRDFEPVDPRKPFEVSAKGESLSYSWDDPLKCLGDKLTSVFQRFGYRHPYVHLKHERWPADLWEALGTYPACASAFMKVWKEQADLMGQRERRAAADAWESAGSDD